MNAAYKARALAVGLALATLAVCLLAFFNLAQESTFDAPTDGVWWVESGASLRAERVPTDSPAARAGIRAGDLLEAVDGTPTPRLAAFERAIFRTGIWARASYSLRRPTRLLPSAPRLEIPVILEPVDKSSTQIYRVIALVYLSIGLYVLFRRWTAPKSTHFYVFCLVSFVLYAFKYTGQLDTFDWTIYWANIAATALQPALFLHFAISFSDHFASRRRNAARRRLLVPLLYLPGLLLVAVQIAAIQYGSATERLQHRLDQSAYAYLALFYVLAAVVFLLRTRSAGSPLERQQLKWLTRGTLLAVIPFTLLYVLPYVFDLDLPAAVTRVAGLSLVILPLTFSWAIVRYRLMDVDLIFKRGVTYTLATASLVGLYFGAVALTAERVHTRLPNLGVYGLLAAIVVTGLVFDPLKRAIQSRVDRVFDQKRFDYRETLVDFGRSLNSQTDLRALLDAIVERLPQTLLVTRVAVFLAEEPEHGQPPAFTLAASHGLTNLPAAELQALDVRFLDFDATNANNHIFLENPQQVLRLPGDQRTTAARLDLNYYLPCRVASREGAGTRTVAILGLGRTRDGDFLSSEDMELLESLAGYIAIALQNAQLYRRLESKIAEFERLKEFHENIVESINVGVFAVDLHDRIESWNAPMEAMYSKDRREVLRQPLSAVFPPEFVDHLAAVRDAEGAFATHNLYKFRLSLPGGGFRIANIAIAPLVTRDMIAVGRIILVDDITDRTQLEVQLTQAEKLSSIGLLAAGVAHEVNTPLAVISSYTQMLSKQLRDDARLAPVLEKITQQTFRASEIVNGLLNFSRTSASAFTTIDINQLLRDTATLLEHQFKTTRIRVETDLQPALAPIHGNQGKLQQVLLNLMLNAKDAMHGRPGATLRLTTRDLPGSVTVTLRDTGSGIDKEHLSRIYDPFFTTKTAPAEGQRKGTGLGLAVTYGIMQEHNGKIHVESEPGVGTTFRLEFPAAAAQTVPPSLAEADLRTTAHA
jgi:PAS domain S-box-containing protein